MKFRKKPIVIDATRWFSNGDHPEDCCETRLADNGLYEVTEGKVVRFFRQPGICGDRMCEQCGSEMNDHGWIDTLEGGHTVCPGDWIITGISGERYPCKPDIFAKTYEQA